MTYLPFHPLTQAVEPALPDVFMCHPFYGQQLSVVDCSAAAGQIPTGNQPVEFRASSRSYQPFRMPLITSWQGCQVNVAFAYVDSQSNLVNAGVQVIPDNVRNLAAWLIQMCVGRDGGIGGFGTINIQNMISFLTDYATTTNLIGDGPWPANAAFMTVTVTGTGAERNNLQDPGLHEPIIAQMFSNVMQNSGKLGGASALASQAQQMIRGASEGWWNAFSTDKNVYKEESDGMAYSCDPKLGNPAVVDCNKLSYSGLGAPSDSVTVGPGPGAGKSLSLDSCHFTVTSAISVTVTWAQIRAALDTLIDSCVADPYNAVTGGIASAGPLKQVRIGTGGSRRKRDTEVTGLNALPPGVNITVSSF